MDLESIKELLLSPKPSEECLAGVAGFLDFAYIEGKSKDNLKARLDLQDKKIRPELHPKNKPNGKYFLPAASYTMSKKQKQQFCKVLHDIKVPDGYSGYSEKQKEHFCKVLHDIKVPDRYLEE